MAKVPAESASAPRRTRMAIGLRLVGFGVVLFVVTRIIRWLPLGIVGSWINGILWPILLLAALAGFGLMYLESKRS